MWLIKFNEPPLEGVFDEIWAEAAFWKVLRASFPAHVARERALWNVDPGATGIPSESLRVAMRAMAEVWLAKYPAPEPTPWHPGRADEIVASLRRMADEIEARSK